jgi:dihydrolipoamide dehydrogenase
MASGEPTLRLFPIRGGPAGFAAAMRASDFGKKVCIVEKNRLGGAGLHDGALSSKVRNSFPEPALAYSDVL